MGEQRAEGREQRTETKKAVTELIGMRQICAHMQRSESTILRLHLEMGFPMGQIGGIWESDTELIKAWKNKIINGGGDESKSYSKKDKKGRLNAQ